MTKEWEFKYHHMFLLSQHRLFFSLFAGRQLKAHSLHRPWLKQCTCKHKFVCTCTSMYMIITMYIYTRPFYSSLALLGEKKYKCFVHH